MLTILKKTLYPTISRQFSKATLVSGTLKGSDQPFRCLILDNSSYGHYLLSKGFESYPKILHERRLWNHALKRIVKKEGCGIDLCVAVLPRRYESSIHGLYSFKGTGLVRQIIDTSGSWEEIKGRFNKDKKRFSNQMGRSGQNYRISKDMNDFDLFYKRMYLPHTEKQFGKRSIIESYEDMKRQFQKGMLIFLMNGEESIAGQLCVVEGKRLTARGIAVLEGNEVHIKAGAQAALYYFMMIYAKENGLNELDTVKSAAFMKDGVYQHKREWGAAVWPDDEAGSLVYFIIPEYSAKIALFFERNPVIVHTAGGLKGLVGMNRTAELLPGTRKRLFDNYYSPGLSGLVFLREGNPPLDMTWKELYERRSA